MHPQYKLLYGRLVRLLNSYDAAPLLGLKSDDTVATLAMQFVESERKRDRILRLANRMPGADRLSPGLESFDPEFSAIERRISGDIEEAAWLTFLSVHFGRHGKDGWLLCRQIYGGLGPTPYWTWKQVTADPASFRPWLDSFTSGLNSPLGRFGNHRKYESITSHRIGLASVVDSYVNWIQSNGGHQALFAKAHHAAGGDVKAAFRILYDEMSAILRFGRLGKFDYLTMLSKLGIAPIEADATYLAEATGPKRGAKLLFFGQVDASVSSVTLETHAQQLGHYLGLGMQTMEDALCNWQKSPEIFVAFRG